MVLGVKAVRNKLRVAKVMIDFFMGIFLGCMNWFLDFSRRFGSRNKIFNRWQ